MEKNIFDLDEILAKGMESAVEEALAEGWTLDEIRGEFYNEIVYLCDMAFPYQKIEEE